MCSMLLVVVVVDTLLYAVSKYGIHEVVGDGYHNFKWEDGALFAISDVVYEKWIKSYLPVTFLSSSEILLKIQKVVLLSIEMAIGYTIMGEHHRIYDNIVAIGVSQAVCLAVEKLRILSAVGL